MKNNYPKACISPFSLMPMGEERPPVDNNYQDIENIIITRYFLTYYASKSKPIDDIQNWFKGREQIFLKLTLPSVTNQIACVPTWIILVERDYQDLLPASLRRLGFIKIVALESNSLNNSSIDSFINNLIDRTFSLSSSCTAITITRLDNDDAIANDFLFTLTRLVEVIRSHSMFLSSASNNPIITFPFGIQISNKQKCNAYIFNNNHFLSSVHLRGLHHRNFANAYSYNHSLIFDKHDPLLLVNTSRPMWAEATHGDNICNWFRNYNLLEINDDLKERFSMQGSLF